MSNLMKSASGKVAGYGAAAGAYLVSIDEIEGLLSELGLNLTAKQLGLLALAIGFAVHRLPWAWSKVKPILSGLYGKLLKWAGAALLVLVPMTADASEARVVLDCAEEVEVLNGKTNEIEKECKRERVYLDLGLRFGGVAFKLNRPREILAGFDAGTGYGVRWRPDFWSLTPSLVSVDLFVNGGYLAREGTGDAVSVGTLLVVTLFDWLGFGGGISHAFGLGNSPDETTWVGTLGIARSI